jgi:hypothetical protein
MVLWLEVCRETVSVANCAGLGTLNAFLNGWFIDIYPVVEICQSHGTDSVPNVGDKEAGSMIRKYRPSKAMKIVYFCNGTSAEIHVVSRCVLVVDFIIMKLPACLYLIPNMYGHSSGPKCSRHCVNAL